MNLDDTKYNRFHLVHEMLQVPEIMAHVLDHTETKQKRDRVVQAIKETGRLFLAGEGSSRIFPAKRFVSSMLGRGSQLVVATEGSRQAFEYPLLDWTVVGASNSGQTKELIVLLQHLAAKNHVRLFGMTANAGSKLTELADSIILSCGKEQAVAATVSVIEQALLFLAIEAELTGCGCIQHLEQAGKLAEQVLAAEYDPALIAKIAAAPVIYWAGRNNGVAEELALKTNEIVRKKSQFLEGSLIVHGVEEVMNPQDVVVLVEPFEADMDFLKQNLVDNVGVTVVALASKPTLFPTILLPNLNRYNEFFQLLAGWNLLVQAGVLCEIDLDKPNRARKIGNAF